MREEKRRKQNGRHRAGDYPHGKRISRPPALVNRKARTSKNSN
jgi:hypothetical protein